MQYGRTRQSIAFDDEMEDLGRDPNDVLDEIAQEELDRESKKSLREAEARDMDRFARWGDDIPRLTF